MGVYAIVLAAGEGTRMKSGKAKVAHELLGKPLIRWVVDAARAAGVGEIISVLGHAREQLVPLVESDTTLVFQEQRLGTADAVAVCAETIASLTAEKSAGKESSDSKEAPSREKRSEKECSEKECSVSVVADSLTASVVADSLTASVVVLSGDCPLITPETIRALIAKREATGAAVVVLTMIPPDAQGYGRIVRNANGEVERIVEQKDCSPEQMSITECNAGFYCFDGVYLFDALAKIESKNAQGEFYLTDIVEIAKHDGLRVEAVLAEDEQECQGINTRVQLAQATKFMQRRINEGHMTAGVGMLDPDLVWIGPDVRLARDIELLPLTFLSGATTVGEGCVIGPNSRLVDTQVGRNCILEETIALEALLDDDVSCGPRAYLRPGTHMQTGSKAGTHVEIKKSMIGSGSKVPHLSYIGDTTMGEGVNIGAGTITCNFDGKDKHRTVIGDGVFVGSDSMLVAPLTIGDQATIGAGSTITKDVSPGALGIERSDQKEVPDWKLRKKKKAEKKKEKKNTHNAHIK